jgi:hypothetical protein
MQGKRQIATTGRAGAIALHGSAPEVSAQLSLTRRRVIDFGMAKSTRCRGC